MRFLAVGNMYPPHHFGGYELVWRSAMEHLRSAGHEVRTLTTDLRTDSALPDDPGVYRELRWYWRDHGFPRRGLRATVALERHDHAVLARHLDDFAPDAVSWWAMGGMPLSLLEAVRRRGLPAVGFVHDDWLDYGPYVDGWLRRFGGRKRLAAPVAERVFHLPTQVDLSAAARYVFVSESTRRRAGAAGVGGAIAHSGIHPAFLADAPEREWTWRLLYVGRLDPRKGVDTAIEALAALPAEATLGVVGGWDDREASRLRELAARLGVSARVEFRGQQGRAELLAAYAEADAVVFPVRWEEPWGLVPLEAMGVGRPVVATGRGGSGEYLRDGDNALLFEAGEPRALAAALERLARDADLRARLRERGRQTAARHTEPLFNAAVLRHLEDAARSGATGLPARRRADPSTTRR